MRNIFTIPSLVIGVLCAPVQAQDFSQLVSTLRGAKLIAQDDENTYLGTFESSYAANSMFNEYGTYGGKYSAKSIWNEFGTFGGQYSSFSPFNSFSSTPPMIIKGGRVIGYLTTNKYIKGALNPNLLKAFSDQF